MEKYDEDDSVSHTTVLATLALSSLTANAGFTRTGSDKCGSSYAICAKRGKPVPQQYQPQQPPNTKVR
jgi:hypothetical protein